MSKINKIAEDYAVSPEEAAEIIQMVEKGVHPSNVTEGSQKGTQTPQKKDSSSIRSLDNQIRQVEDQYLNAEMSCNEAYKQGNMDGFNHFNGELKQLVSKLRKLKSSRKKMAIDMEPQNLENNYEDTEEVSQIVDSQGDLDEETRGEVVGLATSLIHDDSTAEMTAEEAVDAARLQVNHPVNAARAYAFIRNMKNPMACPKCSSKVARAEENPQIFVCKKGHLSEMTFEKMTADNEILEAPSEEAAPQEEAGGFALSQHEKNRFRDVLESGAGGGPMYTLGLIDGFMGSNNFADLAANEQEQQEYTTGSREGQRGMGGVST